MCWVMPPASPAATWVLRMQSSSDVLPWSTWPMKVMIGRAELEFLASGSGTPAAGSATFSSGLWTPAPFSRFSRSKTKPCFSQTLAAMSASIAAVGADEDLQLDQVRDDLERLETDAFGQIA